MTTAQEILKLIEEVSPDDTAKLDEIDAQVYAYLRGKTLVGIENHKPSDKYNLGSLDLLLKSPSGQEEIHGFRGTLTRYTRSRDALKQIRPEGIRNWYVGMRKRRQFGCSIAYDGMVVFHSSGITEELAELHAIIQAIEYERTSK